MNQALQLLESYHQNNPEESNTIQEIVSVFKHATKHNNPLFITTSSWLIRPIDGKVLLQKSKNSARWTNIAQLTQTTQYDQIRTSALHAAQTLTGFDDIQEASGELFHAYIGYMPHDDPSSHSGSFYYDFCFLHHLGIKTKTTPDDLQWFSIPELLRLSRQPKALEQGVLDKCKKWQMLYSDIMA